MAMRIPTVVIVRTQAGVGIIVYALLSLVFSSWQVVNWQPLSFLIVIGYALTYLAIAVLLVWSFKIMEFTKASLILSSELIFAAILGLVMYGEIPTLFYILGSVLIMGACIIPQTAKEEDENKHICIYENNNKRMIEDNGRIL
jgi:drug/metabolite transporter (DMT)-like permease